MSSLHQSNRSCRRRRKHKVNKHKFDHLGAQIDESKVREHGMHRIADNMIFECKVDNNMLNQPCHVQIAELKPDLDSNRLSHSQFEISKEITKKNRKVMSAGSDATVMNHEVITIQVGEDVATKIMSLSGNGWAVCILSVHGAISNVTLRQGASFRETVIYEGYFEILTLRGSYQPLEAYGMSSRTDGLNISLAGPGDRVFGGRVAGPLTAASPVQVVIGRFPVDEKKKLKQVGGTPGASTSAHGGALNGSSSKPVE